MVGRQVVAAPHHEVAHDLIDMDDVFADGNRGTPGYVQPERRLARLKQEVARAAATGTASGGHGRQLTARAGARVGIEPAGQCRGKLAAVVLG